MNLQIQKIKIEPCFHFRAKLPKSAKCLDIHTINNIIFMDVLYDPAQLLIDRKFVCLSANSPPYIPEKKTRLKHVGSLNVADEAKRWFRVHVFEIVDNA